MAFGFGEASGGRSQQHDTSRSLGLRSVRSHARVTAHIPRHDPLLARPEMPRPRGDERLDLVVVPTSRPAQESREAIALAGAVALEHGATLLVIPSQGALADQVVPQDPAVADLTMVLSLGRAARRRWRRLLPKLGTDDHVLSRTSLSALWDTALKRNLALVIASAIGARTVLFLDDDLRAGDDGWVIPPDEVRSALRLVQDGVVDAGGWLLDEFPDNSVVCHTRRLAELDQGIFVGAAAFLLRVGADTPFFPRIYNEDWLFQLPYLLRRSLACFGSVRQTPYDPYQPERAAREELGDVLAEGLYRLCEQPDADVVTSGRSVDYWRQSIEQRLSMIDGLKVMLDLSWAARLAVTIQRRFRRIVVRHLPEAWRERVVGPVRRFHTLRDADDRVRARDALTVSAAQLRPAPDDELAPQFSDWVTTWSTDADVWKAWLATDRTEAVAALLDDATTVPWLGVQTRLRLLSALLAPEPAAGAVDIPAGRASSTTRQTVGVPAGV